MIKQIYDTATAMNSRIVKQEVIANNLANVTTTGFKRDRLFQEMLTEQQSDLNRATQPVTVFEQGLLRETQNTTDLAIEGKGFFVVETPQGTRYTRNGHFRLNAGGELVTEKGMPVMAKGGTVGGVGELFINEKGEIYFDNQLTDRLLVVNLPETQPLVKVGDGLFAPADPQVSALEVESDTFALKQGYLEESNVNAVEEMVRMMTVFRHFEADQKTMQTQNDILGKAVNEIGRV